MTANEQLCEDAKEAIDKVHADMDVSRERCIKNLRDIVSHTETLIQCVIENI